MLDPIGSQVIDYVYAQMKISEKWSLRQERGFTWWGHTVAQRVWADPPREDNGQPITRIHIETDVLREVSDTPQLLTELGLVNRRATLSALVLDTRTSRLGYHSIVYAWPDGVTVSQPLAFSAATLQLGEAFMWAEAFAEALGAKVDQSAHPESGLRTEPDEMVGWTYLLEETGRDQAPLPPGTFEALAGKQPRPWVLATADDGGLTGEYPFFGPTPALLCPRGRPQTALFQACCATHPQAGKGILLRLTLPLESDPALPQSLNQQEAAGWSGASLLGAWCHDEKGPTFVTFLPGILVVPWMIELLSWGANSRTEWARGALLPFLMTLPLN
jgi:hypothetical protein